MHPTPKLRGLLAAAGGLLSAACLFTSAAPAAHADYSETTLHTFINVNGDGQTPFATLVRASDGSFYGTTYEGGTSGEGTVFKLATNGVVSVVHSFGDGTTPNDGGYPYARLTIGSDGLLYGTTFLGGINNKGAVFKMTTTGATTILHSFSAGTDGEYPVGGVTFGSDGKIYGMSYFSDSGSTAEYGTIYRLNTDKSSYVVELRFNSANYGTYGAEPQSTLYNVPGTTSNQFYGTCAYDGAGNGGTLFKFTPGSADGSGSLSVLHAFNDGSVASDGETPLYGRLVFDSSNNIYGTTDGGGANGYGTVFKMTPSGAETILHQFDSVTNDGEYPEEGLMLASDGNFYGSTSSGGANGDGTVFQISPTGSTYNIVYNFAGADGTQPAAKPLEDSDGNLVGTASDGGTYNGSSEYGVIYKLLANLPNPVKLSSASVSPSSVVGGSANATGTVKLNEPAPSSGAVVSLHSANSSVASVPSSVTISANHESATFTVTSHPVSSNSSVSITATYNGSTANGDITVMTGGVALQSVTLGASSAAGGSSLTGNRVSLTGSVSSDTKATLTSSDTSVATVPSSETIQAGSSSHSFTITTYAVTSSKTVTISATYNGVTKTATLTVTPGLQSVTLAASSSKGNKSLTGNRIYFTGSVSSDTSVSLTSSDTSVAIVPSTETILAGSSSHSFTITLKTVTSNKTVTITATSGGITRTANLTVTP